MIENSKHSNLKRSDSKKKIPRINSEKLKLQSLIFKEKLKKKSVEIQWKRGLGDSGPLNQRHYYWLILMIFKVIVL